MDRKLDEQLCAKYPELFRGRRKPMTETLMCWGFDCDDGWYSILLDLCAQITHYCKLNNIEVPEVIQVKEKFGGLRFYLGGIHEGHFNRIYDMIRLAERQSYKTCEVCGMPGTPNKGGWIKTTCEEHRRD